MGRPFIASLSRCYVTPADVAGTCHFTRWANCAGEPLSHSQFIRILVVLTLFFNIAPELFGQTTCGVFGIVTDQQGLPIAQAEVKARQDATGIEKQSVSDSAGNFSVTGRPPGLYTITVGREEFATKVYEHLELTLNRQIWLDRSRRTASGPFPAVSLIGTSPVT
jgi:hypothetical protein